MADTSRKDLFRYLTADESGDYVAIMALFSETLLADLSAVEVAEHLAARATPLERDTAEARCQQLVKWGNLVPSIRDARVSTVADYLRSRSRYQVSKLGGRLHREAQEILHASEGAREVARELLGQIVDFLDRILAAITHAGPDNLDAEAVAGEVTTVFNNQRLFTESVRDFYAYLAGVLSRYDLGGDEYAQFKGLLLDYVDLITADVNRHAPAVADRVDTVLTQIGPLLELLGTVRGLALADGTSVERSKGRTEADWHELATWYGARGGSSGPEQLRAAAGQALGQLITNAKRLLDTSGTGFSRRADLLRLARWFNDADDETAHRIFAGAFLSYPARHLQLGPDEVDPRIGATTSWWNSDPVEVPVSLRQRAERSIRGRSSRVPDPRSDCLLLVAQAREEAQLRRAVAAELLAAGRLDGARVSPAARELVLDRLADLLARHEHESVDTDLGLVLTITPGRNTVLHSGDGDLTIEGLQLVIAAVAPVAEAAAG